MGAVSQVHPRPVELESFGSGTQASVLLKTLQVILNKGENQCYALKYVGGVLGILLGVVRNRKHQGFHYIQNNIKNT